MTLAAGGAALAVAGVFAALRADALAARDAACDASGCDPIARDHHESFRDWTAAANVAWVVGAAALAGGGAWLGVTLARRGSSARVALAPGRAELAWSVRW